MTDSKSVEIRSHLRKEDSKQVAAIIAVFIPVRDLVSIIMDYRFVEPLPKYLGRLSPVAARITFLMVRTSNGVRCDIGIDARYAHIRWPGLSGNDLDLMTPEQKRKVRVDLPPEKTSKWHHLNKYFQSVAAVGGCHEVHFFGPQHWLAPCTGRDHSNTVEPWGVNQNGCPNPHWV